MASIWNELKRRNVVRVAVAYGVVSWLVLQLTDVLMPILDLPEWVDGLVFLLLLVGFLLALVLSWAYELTPDGIAREKDVDRSVSITPSTGRKLDRVIIAVLAVALVIFAVERFAWNSDPSPEMVVDDGPRTIAVLPFLNMSADPDQEFFSDGLTEELLNLLAKVPDLRVTSRTSSFAFKGREIGINEIARELDVKHILEGSVRRSGDTIRITAQLIDVSSDTHMWSETWDRTFDDVFVIQDEIAEAVVDALRINLLGGELEVQETSDEAYALYLRSTTLIAERTLSSLTQAEALLTRVLELDPAYVPAWEALGRTYATSGALSIWEPREVSRRLLEVAESILELDARNARAHALLGRRASAFEYDRQTTETEIGVALEMAPNDVDVLMGALGSNLVVSNGEMALEYARIVAELDPLSPSVQLYFAHSLRVTGALEEAAAKYREAIAMSKNGDMLPNANYMLGWTLFAIGDYDDALEAFNLEVRRGLQLTGQTMVYRLYEDTARADEALAELHTLSDVFTYELARVYADRADADEAFLWLDRAFDRRDLGLSNILNDDRMDSLRTDPRFDAFLARMNLNQLQTGN
jgi:TolB-like protein